MEAHKLAHDLLLKVLRVGENVVPPVTHRNALFSQSHARYSLFTSSILIVFFSFIRSSKNIVKNTRKLKPMKVEPSSLRKKRSVFNRI